jgi:hypothetical protein
MEVDELARTDADRAGARRLLMTCQNPLTEIADVQFLPAHPFNDARAWAPVRSGDDLPLPACCVAMLATAAG